MEPTRALVLGLGNDLISDDGFGPAVVAAARPSVAYLPGVRLETAAAGGFRLLDLLAGARNALIVDVVQTGRQPPGTVSWWPFERAELGRTLGTGHGMDLPSVLAFGAAVGWQMPQRVDLLVAEARDLETIGGGLTPEVEAALAPAVERVAQWVTIACRHAT